MASQKELWIAGNWKLNHHSQQAVHYFQELQQGLQALKLSDRIHLAIAPVATSLVAVRQLAKLHKVDLWAQHLSLEHQGAYTGEISGGLLKEAGASKVLIGHSERRHLFGETLALSAKRLQCALQEGLDVVLCVGECLEERQAGLTEQIIAKQLDAALSALDVSQWSCLLIAYEPVWAIGTGEVASLEQIQQVHQFIRQHLRFLAKDLLLRCPILYGGSVKPQNASAILALADVDGALVGGASLKVVDFLGIAAAATTCISS